MNTPSKINGSHVGGNLDNDGVFVGHDQIILINDFSGEHLELALAQLRTVLARGDADLRTDLDRGRLTVTAPGAPRIELSAKAADALTITAARQGDVAAYLTALRVNPRFGLWAALFVPLAGALDAEERAPGWATITPEFRLLEMTGDGPGRQMRRIPLDDITQATARYPTLVLLGEPGAGKSTTLYRLALDAARQRLTSGAGSLPLYCSLADYRSYAAPYNFVAARLRQFTGEDAAAWLRRGELCLLCDALNEMPFSDERDYREKVGAWRRFVDDWPGNQIIFTCRSQDYVESLGQHQVDIAPMDDPRVQDFLTKYGVSFAWERLRESPLLKLARNPYYLSMLAHVLRRGGAWPESRAELFRGFVAALLEREQRKQHPDWPGAETLHAELAALGGRMQALGAGTRLPRSAILAQAPESDVVTGNSVPAETTLRLGLAATLLDTELVPDGEEHVRFYHHQVQEYFAAHALLARFKRGEDLSRCWRQPRRGRDMPDPGKLGDYEPLPPPPPTGWEEATILAAGLAPDPAAFLEAVRATNPVLAARCLTEAGLRKKLPDLTRQAQTDLLRDMSDPRVHLRARLAAGDALGRLGDPRFEEIVVEETRVLLPPLIYVPAGPFMMGTARWRAWLLERRGRAVSDELPQQRVELPEYYIGRYPVTNAEYACFVDAKGYQSPNYWQTAAARAWLRGETQESAAVKDLLKIWRTLKDNPAEFARLRRAGVPQRQLDAWEEFVQMDENEARAEFSKSYTERPRDRPAYWDDARYSAPNQPVVGVTWFEAMAYCAWLGEQLKVSGCALQVWRSGQMEPFAIGDAQFVIRLPSEAEWEKGTSPPAPLLGGEGRQRALRVSQYAWGNNWDAARANTWEGHVLRPSPVGAYPRGASARGGHDFNGNVRQWTRSLYRPYPYISGDGREDPEAEGYRVTRGGSWIVDQTYARCAYRDRGIPGGFDYDVGFRVALSLGILDSEC